MWDGIKKWFGFGGLQRRDGKQQAHPSGYTATAAAPVTFDSAMQLSAVWASARLLSETIAGLPIEFKQTDESGKTKIDTSSDLATLFDGGRINRYQTQVEFLETLVLNLVMHGNAYAIKQRSGNRLVGLLPLMSGQVETELLHDGSVIHNYHHDGGVHSYAAESVWHIKLFGNGIVGLSPLAYARNSFGLALAAENRVAQIYKNGAKPTGVLTIDRVLGEEQRNAIRQSFKDLREGNADTMPVLEAGLKYQQVSMTPDDIELLDTRRFQIEDIARFFGVPSVLINDTSGSTTWGSGIQQIVQGFYKLNLRPYLERIEASIRANLMTPEQRRNTTVAFDFDALLRANQQERYEGYQKGINAGMLTPNEARKGEGLPHIAGGDQLLVNGNMIPVTQAGRPQQKRQNAYADETTSA